MTNHIVLYQPEIPPNTGNIARTCAATGTVLHLIKPLGFNIDDRSVRRAGLDYWDKVDIRLYDSLDDFMTHLGQGQLYLITKFARQIYSEVDYRTPEGDIYLMFGRETTGLPAAFMRQHEDKCLRIPMDDTHVRALNLSNCVALILYEVLRQKDFPNLERTHHYANDKLA